MQEGGIQDELKISEQTEGLPVRKQGTEKGAVVQVWRK